MACELLRGHFNLNPRPLRIRYRKAGNFLSIIFFAYATVYSLEYERNPGCAQLSTSPDDSEDEGMPSGHLSNHQRIFMSTSREGLTTQEFQNLLVEQISKLKMVIRSCYTRGRSTPIVAIINESLVEQWDTEGPIKSEGLTTAPTFPIHAVDIENCEDEENSRFSVLVSWNHNTKLRCKNRTLQVWTETSKTWEDVGSEAKFLWLAAIDVYSILMNSFIDHAEGQDIEKAKMFI